MSLSGAVRPVAQTAPRLKEAQKLGFTKAIVPEAARNDAPDGFTLSAIGTLANLVADIARDGSAGAAARRPTGHLKARPRAIHGRRFRPLAAAILPRLRRNLLSVK